MILSLNFELKAQDVIIDETHLAYTLSNWATRNGAAIAQKGVADKYLKDYKKVNEIHSVILIIQQKIESSLFNVNSALKNSLAVKDIANQVEGIYNELSELLETCKDYPQYSILGKKYIEYGTVQAIALSDEVQKFALSGTNNIMMNYRQRDQVIREIQIRLSLIRANIRLVNITIKRASKIGLLRSYTVFGDWYDSDSRMVKDIIARSKYLKK